jgi:hypothetical protein
MDLMRNKKKPSLFDAAMTPPILPEEDADAMASPVSTKPTLFAQANNETIDPKSSLGGSMNDYGLERPDNHKTKWWETLLDIGLPALASAGSGEGLIPGAAVGYFNHRANQGGEYRDTVDRFEKDRVFKQKDRSIDADDKMAEAQLNALSGYRDQSLDIDRQNADTARAKAQADINQGMLGQRLPAGQAENLAEGKSIPRVLDDLDKTLDGNTDIGGPILGQITTRNPYATKTQAVQAQIDATRQMVGKFLEGGVLRKEDEYKYKRILPTLTDTPEVRKQKINIVRDLVQKKYNENLNSFGQAGYNVSNFNQLQSNQTPAGATGKVKGSDGNWYWTDGKNNLGRAQ